MAGLYFGVFFQGKDMIWLFMVGANWLKTFKVFALLLNAGGYPILGFQLDYLSFDGWFGILQLVQLF